MNVITPTERDGKQRGSRGRGGGWRSGGSRGAPKGNEAWPEALGAKMGISDAERKLLIINHVAAMRSLNLGGF